MAFGTCFSCSKVSCCYSCYRSKYTLFITILSLADVIVRQCVIDCFIEVEDYHLLSHIAQPHMLEILFMSLHDEKLEMQEVLKIDLP